MIKDDPVNILGEITASKFDNSLPFLLKVLAAEKPLSLQAHPNKAEAFEGFERENNVGISLMSPNRNYRDINHKPECICAVSDFYALNGFRPLREIAKFFKKISIPEISTFIEDLYSSSSPDSLMNFYSLLYSLKKDSLQKLIDNALKSSHKDIQIWMNKMHDEHPYDIAVLAPLFMNLVHLAPGEAMNLETNILHLYLSGLGIELMTNSDNVIRGGMTTKHVDLQELLKILRFEHTPIERLQPVKVSDTESCYKTFTDEFALSIINVNQNLKYTSSSKREVEILLCYEGSGTIKSLENLSKLNITKGNSILAPASCGTYTIEGDIKLYKAAVPVLD
jgi:mannose-6-phosphate isomerase